MFGIGAKVDELRGGEMSDYHSRPEVSATMVKSMAKGWRKFEADFITRTAPRLETKSLSLGTAVHAALLEPQTFASKYIVCPESCSDRRTKAYKEWAAGVSPDAEVLSPGDFATIEHIIRHVNRDAVAKKLIDAAGLVEQERYWTSQNGVLCRLRLDKIIGSKTVLDIKTTQDAMPWSFRSTLGTYRYDLQAAHYLEGTGAEVFFFVVVETTCPWRVRTYRLKARSLAFAEEQRKRLLDEYKSRIVSGDWSESQEGEVIEVDSPEYLRGEE